MRLALLALAVSIVLMPGCLERRETLTIQPDGSVLVSLEFDARSRGELQEGDAIPVPAGGWQIEEWIETDDKGDDHYRLRAEAEFGPADPLPSSFAPPGDPWTETYLQFPTTLDIEVRPDGFYYHFRRVYPARSWAQAEALRKQLLDEKLKVLHGKDLEELTPQDRAMAVGAYIDFETAKLLSFARPAYLKASPDAPQDRWLAVAAAVHDLQGRWNIARVVEFLAIEDQQERDDALDEEARRWEAEARQVLETALRAAGRFDGGQMRTFQRHYEVQRRSHDVTEDLGDDAFEISVIMPGEIVGANTDTVTRSRATWRFGGERFRDHSMELLVSSRLELVPPDSTR